MTDKSERYFWLGFSVFPGIGPKKFSGLLDHFGSAEKAWLSEKEELRAVLGPLTTEKFISFRLSFSLALYIDQLEKKRVWFVTLQDAEYPSLLETTPNPPFVIYGKGEKTLLNSHSVTASEAEKFLHNDEIITTKRSQTDTPIAIVGTRKVTSYGRQVTEMITQDLVHAGCVVVSGLALGVDAIAHQITIEEGGKTVAVLGCGVDCCYPSTNQQIYDRILSSGGAVISEFPPSMQPSIGSFPSRNRIIAGMSEATIVTEGAEDSGSLITAESALTFGRKVFAVPGPITSSLSKGPLKLLQKGAVLVTSGEDILRELSISTLNFPNPQKKEIKGDTDDEQKIIDLLIDESLSVDELVKRSDIEIKKLGSLLSVMEIKGMIQLSPAGMISLEH